MLIDCHTHLDQYGDEDVRLIMERSRATGVAFVITAGTTVAASDRCVALTATHHDMFAGVGIHPMDLTGPVDETTYGALKSQAISTDKVIVMSEIGLDFMEGCPPREVQYQAFREQIRLALELRLPIVYHSREAHAESIRVLREEQAHKVGGAVHYFQADWDTARHAIDLGFYISLARPLLRLPHLQEVAARTPLEWIVLETDAFPQPFKPKRENWTEPRHLVEIAAKLAEIKNMDPAQVIEATGRNALRMLEERRSAIARYVQI
ncbi:MAG: TatD family deoxyribonuclease [SAR202 cluster bacterium]|nr:TatD family deoxyribonuclease [SAR202 cluster bacterium]